VQHVDPAECGDAGIDHASDVIRAEHITSDCLAHAAFRLDDPLGLDGDIGLMSTAGTPAPSRAKSTAVALPLRPLEPAPETNATLSLSRSTMLSFGDVWLDVNRALV